MRTQLLAGAANGDAAAKHSPLGNDADFAAGFGAFLVEEKAIDELALQRSLRAAAQSGERFDHVLTKLGLVPEADLCAHLAKFLEIPRIEPAEIPLQPPCAATFPRNSSTPTACCRSRSRGGG
jgi:general secretion pathway protein E